jgi:predicted transcriptional regulator of viral defense system
MEFATKVSFLMYWYFLIHLLVFNSVVITCHIWYNNYMKFEDLLAAIVNEPVFETGLLLVGNVDPGNVQRQLSRWVKSGRLLQLRRGLYALAAPYQKTVPHPFLVANRLVRGSYVSLQSALSYHGLIPEGVTTVTNVTTGRPGVFETALGRFEFRHIKPPFLQGFRMTELGKDKMPF